MQAEIQLWIALGPRFRGDERLSNPHQSLAHHIAGEQGGAEYHDHEGRRSFQPAQEEHSGTGLRLSQPPGKPARANRERGDCGNGDRGAETHHESRRHTDPEQPLRQRENEHDDRTRTWPQTDRDDCGKTAPEPMPARQFLRLGRMGMAPGRRFISVIVVMMIMSVRVPVMMMIVMMNMVVRVMRIAAQQLQESAAFYPQ